MRYIEFHLPYGKKEDNLFLEARINKVQEEGEEGTNNWWYKTEVGYPAGKHIKHFSELRGIWEEGLGYKGLAERATSSLHEAVKKLRNWCKRLSYDFEKEQKLELIGFRDRTFSPKILIP